MGRINKNHTQTPIGELLTRPLLSSKDLRKNGHGPGLLSYYERQGLIERVGRGLYRNLKRPPQIDFQWEDLVYTVLSIPNGVVTGISALALYGPTDEIPRKHWIAIPHGTSVGKHKNLYSIRTRNHNFGIVKMSVGEVDIPIYELERVLVELFRLAGKETAIKALREAFLSHKPDLNIKKIFKYAKKLRVNIEPYLLTVTTL